MNKSELQLKMPKQTLVRLWNVAAAREITLDQLFEEILDEAIQKHHAERIIAAGKIIKFPRPRL
jgi:hypothetical protein